MPPKTDASTFIDKKFNRLTITSDVGVFDGVRKVMAVCECGIIKEYTYRSLLTGNTKSCGCIKNRINEYLNKKFGRLTILSEVGIVDGRTAVIAKCECGEVKQFVLKQIISGIAKSCGCITRTKNGLSKTSLFNVWVGMISRCYNKDHKPYKYYGAQGVVVCDNWKNDFNQFYDWAKDKWSAGLQLDKDKMSIDGRGDLYSPETCCFLTPKENCRNRRSNINIEFLNETHCIAEWAEILGVSFKVIWGRIRRGSDPVSVLDKLYKKKLA